MLYPAQLEEIEGNDVILDEDGGEAFFEFSEGFAVTFRDVPEVITQGKNFLDAINMAQDALRTAMQFYKEGGKPLPAPSLPQHGDVLINL